MTAVSHQYVATSVEMTEAMGCAIGAALHVGDVIALHGPLGAGKTCFVRGLARGIEAPSHRVRSPTFVLHHMYRGRIRLHHVDCYRLGSTADLTFLDIDALLEGGALAVEWAEYADVEALRPFHITLEPQRDSARIIRMNGDIPDRVVNAWMSCKDPS